MVHAFIMVKTAAGKSEGLLSQITDIESVAGAHIVAGNYDIIIEIDAPEVYDVLKAVSSDIQGLDGVTDTKTYIAMDQNDG
ncbi:Lrp/AsnC family transcription regulator [Natrialba magadii ATCC 43099]|uniref:AsnC family transcriptional regulator n=1 Tax=Natrialba magadii (strain ATCC 43099 / DSM 3394 / CCM 3739 / CIP 104546 / IAM 13178 / JCM 8861 / NBRC 102185 / NCIMB 2190 / MS3) TaxID=547559 RepID=D3SYZ3_NATMM|nr:Lrp/AsnC ligand binding domain-containing protein [Natrialba magadii]ADD06185.1 Lrp/AsnC family transcription regulator [Natrialba magadii ATCC 43099]ELY30816.1 AsnC family transcriptional regulator [Natrialba magadii ATCC 43099]